jgi:dCMP deaminase
MKLKFKQYYMNIAYESANLSHAIKLKVGAVIVTETGVMLTSWNGTPIGWDNVCEDEMDTIQTGNSYLKTKPEVIHAESNCISKLAKSTETGKGAFMFITHAPCIECAKLIYQTGITKVFYTETYRSTAGLEFLEKCGITIEKLND